VTDDELMLAFRGGRGEAFEELFARYRQPVWAFFRRLETPGRIDERGRLPGSEQCPLACGTYW